MLRVLFIPRWQYQDPVTIDRNDRRFCQKLRKLNSMFDTDLTQGANRAHPRNHAHMTMELSIL